MEGVVKQLNNNGQVVFCSCENICRQKAIVENRLNIFPKTCLLSVDHGGRCFAYPEDASMWLITENQNDVRQILNN